MKEGGNISSSDGGDGRATTRRRGAWEDSEAGAAATAAAAGNGSRGMRHQGNRSVRALQLVLPDHYDKESSSSSGDYSDDDSDDGDGDDGDDERSANTQLGRDKVLAWRRGAFSAEGEYRRIGIGIDTVILDAQSALHVLHTCICGAFTVHVTSCANDL